VGIEKDKTGQYPDKNKIQKVLTPDHSKYQQVMAGETIVPEGVQQKQQNAPSDPQQPAWVNSKPEQQAPQSSNPIPSWAT
jgi:hypothetical protein